MFNSTRLLSEASNDKGFNVSLESRGSAEETEMDTAYRFLGSVVIWFDLLSCVSLSQGPRTTYEIWLSENNVDMSAVMGCQNWAMLEIGNIARFSAWKSANEKFNTLSMRELVSKGVEIESRIEEGIQKSYTIGEVRRNRLTSVSLIDPIPRPITSTTHALSPVPLPLPHLYSCTQSFLGRILVYQKFVLLFREQ